MKVELGLRKRRKNLVKRLLEIFEVTFVISGFMDIYLWFAISYHIPSWTIGIISLVMALLTHVFKSVILG